MNLCNATVTLLLACSLALGSVPANADTTDLETHVLPEMPDAVASFGAAVLGDHLYVYGGHIGRSHQHSTDNLSHHFRRLDLRRPEGGWQDLGAVPGLQGLALVAVGDEVCRLGGMTARNGQEEDEDLYSVDDVQCFRPADAANAASSAAAASAAAGSWHALPSLPTPRSSHDAVVLDGHIYVVGGWQLRGAELDPVWHDELWRLDPSAAEPTWEHLEQPFQRRALAVAAMAGRLYAIGGLNEDGTSRQVDVFDPETGSWSQGPDLPAEEGLKGFGAAAFGAGGRLYSSTADGNVHALDPAGAWRASVHTLDHPRFFHRLLFDGDQLLFVGGAHRGGHRADIEVVPLASLVGDTFAAWPGFRGFGDSHARSSDMPVSWSQSELAWHVELPGYGQSSPVVWGNKVFVTSIEGEFKETLVLTCLDLHSGEVSWQRRFPASQKIEYSEMVSRAAPTPVVDAHRVYAFWESGDVIALDHQGEALWQRSLTDDYGPFQGNHGVVSCADKQSGELRWRHRLGETCWASPIAAGDSVYFFTRKGATTVLRHDGGDVTVVAENLLPTDDTVYGVAAVPGAFLIRTGHELVRVGRSE